MTTTASVILSAAYNRSSANDPGKLAQDEELLGHLDRVYQRTYALIARARPDEMAAARSVVLTGSPAVFSIAPNTMDVIGIRNATGYEINLVPATQVYRRWVLAPAMSRVGLTVTSRNQAGDPLAGDVVTVLELPAPASITTLASTIDPNYPIRHVQLLIDYLACYLSVKDAGRDEGDRAALMGELRQDAAAFAAEYELAPSATEWLHGDVERHTAVPQ